MKQIVICLFILIANNLHAQVQTIDTSSVPIYYVADTLANQNSESIKDTLTKKHFQLKEYWGDSTHSVKKAAIFSAIIPGLGQIYNDKWWKVPIVYAALGTSGYFVYSNYAFYNELKTEYKIRTDGDSTTIDNYVGQVGDSEFLVLIDTWRKYGDLSVIITAAFYMLNIVDAVVDANLYNFDIDDNLSLSIKPYFLPSKINLNTNTTSASIGVNLKFSFK